VFHLYFLLVIHVFYIISNTCNSIRKAANIEILFSFDISRGIRQYTSEVVDEPTTIKVFQGADGEYTLYSDDGITSHDPLHCPKELDRTV